MNGGVDFWAKNFPGFRDFQNGERRRGDEPALCWRWRWRRRRFRRSAFLLFLLSLFLSRLLLPALFSFLFSNRSVFRSKFKTSGQTSFALCTANESEDGCDGKWILVYFDLNAILRVRIRYDLLALLEMSTENIFPFKHLKQIILALEAAKFKIK